ncbi:hypothetical protein DACRYDRAFT_24708 [Dacryopinax primogenitus]|uniref:Vacuolar import and degradation protein 21 n=1 Tax=Dacryopinax primogenitus (strain DJM 731) TaxID=1858805 RepID=M5FXL9_DACPD|nr:uncharacterized protein DACRYDRAFT_24708 [Dacryopinax primogenitus]EJT98246.1 hypothetical protein DACRYDRAFT_24708 [Dacryopinax primogenitus]
MVEERERQRRDVIGDGRQDLLELFELLSNAPGELVGGNKQVPDHENYVKRWAASAESVMDLSVDLLPIPRAVVSMAESASIPMSIESPKSASSLHLSPSPIAEVRVDGLNLVHDVLTEDEIPSPERATISRRTSRQPSAAPTMSVRAASSKLGLSPTSSDSEPLTEPPTSPRADGIQAAVPGPSITGDMDDLKGAENFYNLSSWNHVNLPPLKEESPEKSDPFAACWSIPDDSWFSSVHPPDQPLSTSYTDTLSSLARTVTMNGPGGQQAGKKRKRHRRDKDAVKGEFAWLAASIGANPVHKHAAHPAKCMTTRDWMVVYREFTFLQAVAEIDELQQRGLWSLRQPKRQPGPPVRKAHWGYLLEEMQWMQTDFVEERQWKAALTYEISLCIKEWWSADERGKRALQAGWKRHQDRRKLDELDQDMDDPEAEEREREERRQRNERDAKQMTEEEEGDMDAENEGDGESEDDELPRSPMKRRRVSSVPGYQLRQSSMKEEDQPDELRQLSGEQEHVEEEAEGHDELDHGEQEDEEMDAEGEADADVDEDAEEDAEGDDDDAEGDGDVEGDSEEVEQAAGIVGEADDGHHEVDAEQHADDEEDEDMDAEGEEDAEGTPEEADGDEDGAEGDNAQETSDEKAQNVTKKNENGDGDEDEDAEGDADAEEDAEGDADAEMKDEAGETEAATGSQLRLSEPTQQLHVLHSPQQEQHQEPQSPQLPSNDSKDVIIPVSTPEAKPTQSPRVANPVIRIDSDVKGAGSHTDLSQLFTGPVLASPEKESPTSPVGPFRDATKADSTFLLPPETPTVDVQSVRLPVLELPSIETIFDPHEVTGRDDYDTLLDLFPDLQVYDLSEPVEELTTQKDRKSEPLPGLPLLMSVKPVLVSTLKPTSQNWDGEHEDWELLLDEPKDIGKPGVLSVFSGRKPGTAIPAPLQEPHHPAARIKALHWNNEDDAILLTCVTRFGENWDLVADAFNTKRNTIAVDWRTPWDCAKRWGIIKPKEGPVTKDIDRARRMDNVAPHPYYQRQEGTKKKERQVALRDVVRKAIKKREQSGPKYSTSKKINLTAHNTHGTLEKNVPSPGDLARQKYDKENMLRLERFAINQANPGGQRLMTRVPSMSLPPVAPVPQQPVSHGPNGQPLTSAHLALMQQQQRLQAQASQSQAGQTQATPVQASAAAMQHYSPQVQAAMMQAQAAAVARAQQAGVNISRAHQAAAAANALPYPGMPPNGSPPSAPMQQAQFQSLIAQLKNGSQITQQQFQHLSKQANSADIIRMLYQQAGYPQQHQPQHGPASSASPPQPHTSPTIPPS